MPRSPERRNTPPAGAAPRGEDQARAPTTAAAAPGAPPPGGDGGTSAAFVVVAVVALLVAVVAGTAVARYQLPHSAATRAPDDSLPNVFVERVGWARLAADVTTVAKEDVRCLEATARLFHVERAAIVIDEEHATYVYDGRSSPAVMYVVPPLGDGTADGLREALRLFGFPLEAAVVRVGGRYLCLDAPPAAAATTAAALDAAPAADAPPPPP